MYAGVKTRSITCYYLTFDFSTTLIFVIMSQRVYVPVSCEVIVVTPLMTRDISIFISVTKFCFLLLVHGLIKNEYI